MDQHQDPEDDMLEVSAGDEDLKALTPDFETLSAVAVTAPGFPLRGVAFHGFASLSVRGRSFLPPGLMSWADIDHSNWTPVLVFSAKENIAQSLQIYAVKEHGLPS